MRKTHNNLPTGCTLEYDEFGDCLHIAFHGYYVISTATGRRKFVAGNDDVAKKRARLFAWKFLWNAVDGYRLEMEEETK